MRSAPLPVPRSIRLDPVRIRELERLSAAHPARRRLCRIKAGTYHGRPGFTVTRPGEPGFWSQRVFCATRDQADAICNALYDGDHAKVDAVLLGSSAA